MRQNDQDIRKSLASNALDITEVQPGDIGIAHSKGLLGWLIRVGTHSYWNHVFVVISCDGTVTGTLVIQAEAHGVQYASLDKVAPGGEWAILPCPTGVDRLKVIAEAGHLNRIKYAFVSIISIAFNLLPLPVRLNVHENGTLICSAVGALALLAGGWLKQWPDLYSVTPAELATALAAPST